MLGNTLLINSAEKFENSFAIKLQRMSFEIFFQISHLKLEEGFFMITLVGFISECAAVKRKKTI